MYLLDLRPTMAAFGLLFFAMNTQNSPLKIVDIQLTHIAEFMSINATVDSNRTSFDVNFSVEKQLPNHNMILNMILKFKAAQSDHYTNLYKWKRIDLCKFLVNYDEGHYFKYFFKNAARVSAIVRCPIRMGTYALKNFTFEQNLLNGALPDGSYRMFVELAQRNEEPVKMFNMQITAANMQTTNNANIL